MDSVTGWSAKMFDERTSPLMPDVVFVNVGLEPQVQTGPLSRKPRKALGLGPNVRRLIERYEWLLLGAWGNGITTCYQSVVVVMHRLLRDDSVWFQFVVPDADLIILEWRDARFYYVYRLQKPHPHPKLNTAVPDASKYIKETWVYIVDTSPEHQKQRFDFEETLSVPIGPDLLMDEIGAIRLLKAAARLARFSYSGGELYL
ncbi:uncharacterized protein LACBIDRAFT_321948 [Laccaria bicolor S238N-H82]|uniref:Predicted protein n=1 Tax=Laccaria bicolor (strain S238N-H82 / ATCC MYA-4686) TaxID=486041 RepID=B0CUR0_LACBS|nr:uncharacterized protein LACBIDRAFT_321948 [Laccaria bicolor S238N-H82]EDR14137.1 predicted protein [Laccaria bicolor S238N-H82]|eukprot:XP_001874696.1 predicted protein [Laccaria bicolor S238N-H82]